MWSLAFIYFAAVVLDIFHFLSYFYCIRRFRIWLHSHAHVTGCQTIISFIAKVSCRLCPKPKKQMHTGGSCFPSVRMSASFIFEYISIIYIRFGIIYPLNSTRFFSYPSNYTLLYIKLKFNFGDFLKKTNHLATRGTWRKIHKL
jgi:hypothetical protein